MTVSSPGAVAHWAVKGFSAPSAATNLVTAQLSLDGHHSPGTLGAMSLKISSVYVNLVSGCTAYVYEAG